MTNALLSFDGLRVGYRHRGREHVVLREAGARVQAGELIGLVGPNGAGKSTLLRSISGLQPYFAGEVSVLGEPLEALSRVQRAQRIAVVLTDRFNPGRLSVSEVVGLGRYAHSSWNGRLRPRDHAVIERCLDQVGASHLAGAPLMELSDGQRQRVMVARGLAQEPRVLLLDEPTAFLDPPGRIEVLELMRQLSTELDMGIVVCTHDLEVVLRYADALWVADRSGELFVGGPEQLAYEQRLDASFRTAGVRLDLDRLTFQAVRAGLPEASVSGEGAAAALARHCLLRAGFAVAAQPGRPVVTVEAAPGRWVVAGRGERRVCADLTELYAVVRPRALD